MKIRVKRLVVGQCPICDKELLKKDDRGKFLVKNGDGVKEPDARDLWVEYSDGSNAVFLICKDCMKILDIHMANDIQDYQRYTWGLEILDNPMGAITFGRQIEWYIKTAVHLRVVKFSGNKDGL